MERVGQGSRFEVVRRVGAGGMGVIYEARDRTSGERLAIKTLHDHDATALFRLKQEFRGMQNIVHPNLIAFRELVEDGGQWLLVMEFIEGCNARDYVRGPDEGLAIASTNEAPMPTSTFAIAAHGPPVPPRDYARVRAVIAQIAAALEHLHAAGHVHCDIKPANVLVDHSGHAIVLDLGLARLAADVHDSNELAGTVPYISPEQVRGEPATGASDCYALGVMLFEMLTGHWPFTGTAVQILDAKCALDAPDRSALPATTPADLAELCVALLQREPDRRPTAKQVLGMLRTEPAIATAEANAPKSVFVGRDDELQRLRDALVAVRKGDLRIVWVRGASGVGKSSLVASFVDEVNRTPNAVLLAARCYERENVPFKAVDGIVDALSSLLRTLDDGEVAALLPRYLTDLCAAFPVLARVPEIERTVSIMRGRAAGSPHQLDRAFAALRELLTRLADRRTVVLVIDDLQWGDADSMRLLREVLRTPDAPQLLTILTSRDEPAVEALVARLEAAPDVFRRLDLAALDRNCAADLARRLLAQVGVDDPRIAAAIGREANGHPLHISELVKHVATTHADDTSIRLDDAIAARVDRLPAHQRELLQLVCVSAGPIAAGTLQRAAGIDGASLLTNRTLLTTANLVKAGAPAFSEPFHDRIREIVASRLAADELRTLHHRLAVALESSQPEPPAEMLVAHFTGCAMPERAAVYAARAARACEERLAFHRAVELYEFALAHGQHEPHESATLMTRCAHSLSRAGRPLDAARTFAAAATRAEGQDRLDLERLRVEHLLLGGELEDGGHAARELARGVGVVLPRSQTGLIATLLVERARLRMRGLSFDARDESQVDPATLQRLDVLWSFSSGMTFINPVASVATQTRFLREALAAGEPLRVALAYSLELGYCAMKGANATAEIDELYARATALAERLDSALVRGFVDAGRGLGSCMSGEFSRAMDTWARAEAQLRETGQIQWAVGIIQTYRMELLWQLGRYRDLVALQREYIRAAEEQGNTYTQHRLMSWMGNRAWLVRDDVAAARAAMASGARDHSTRQVQLADYNELVSNTYIDLYERAGITAWQQLRNGWSSARQFSRIQFIAIESTFLRGWAALAAGSQLRDASTIAERCAKRLARIGTKFSQMLATQLRAAIAAEHGERDAAVRLFHDAIRRAEALDTKGYAMAARMRMGDLLDDPDARAQASEAESFFREQGVVAPRRFASLLAPGLGA